MEQKFGCGLKKFKQITSSRDDNNKEE